MMSYSHCLNALFHSNMADDGPLSGQSISCIHVRTNLLIILPSPNYFQRSLLPEIGRNSNQSGHKFILSPACVIASRGTVMDHLHPHDLPSAVSRPRERSVDRYLSDHLHSHTNSSPRRSLRIMGASQSKSSEAEVQRQFIDRLRALDIDARQQQGLPISNEKDYVVVDNECETFCKNHVRGWMLTLLKRPLLTTVQSPILYLFQRLSSGKRS